MPYDRVGIVPGSVGDMIIESQRQMRPKVGMRPMAARRVRTDSEVIRPVTDYRPTPMPKRGRGGREM
jgi:hypothetical protein